MGLFKKKQMDQERSNDTKTKMRTLFNQVMDEGDSYDIVYAISQKIKTSNYILARKTTYIYTSLIVGFRQSDMRMVILQTTPEIEGCSDPEIYTRDDFKKCKIVQGQFTFYHQGGLMAGYMDLCIMDSFDDRCMAYINQPEEAAKWDTFWAQFAAK